MFLVSLCSSCSQLLFFLRKCGRDQPQLKFFARSVLQATLLHSQHTLQRIRVCHDDSLEAGQVRGLAFCRKDQLSCSISEIFEQGYDHSGRLIRIGSRENAFFDSLLDDLLQHGSKSFDTSSVEFVTHDGILITVPDVQERQHQALVSSFPVVERGKEALEFVQSRKLGIMDDGEHELGYSLPHAFDKGLKQRWFGLRAGLHRE